MMFGNKKAKEKREAIKTRLLKDLNATRLVGTKFEAATCNQKDITLAELFATKNIKDGDHK